MFLTFCPLSRKLKEKLLCDLLGSSEAGGDIMLKKVTMRNLINRLIRIELEAYYVVELDLEGFVPPEFRQIDHSIVKVSKTEGDISELIEFWPDDYRFGRNKEQIKNAILSHLASGDECFLALVDGEIAGMLWVGYQGNYMLNDMAQRDGLEQQGSHHPPCLRFT